MAASDFKDAVDALQKTNAELGRAVGDSVKTGLKGAAKDITKPFTDSLSAIPGMSTLGGLGKTLFNKALSTRKEKKAQELLRKQLGVSKEQFKLLKDEKTLSDKRKAQNAAMLAASENLLGFTGEKFSAMMAGALNPGMNRVIKGHGENAHKTITGMDTLFKDQMKATISGNKLLENPKPTAAETEAAQKAESKAAREQSVFHDIRDGIVGLNAKFMQKMKEKGKAGLGLIAALIAAPIVALLAFFKEIGMQLKLLGITGKGGLVAKMFAPIGKLFAGIKNFFKAFTVVKKITPFIDDIIKGAKTVLKPIGRFFSKIGNFFSKMIGYVKTITSASKSATGILKFASKFGSILGKIFLPITILMSAFDFITGFMKGYEEGGILGGLEGGLSKLFANMIGMPLDLLKSAVAWIAGVFGFDGVKTSLESFSFATLITDMISGIFAGVKGVFNFLGDLFDFSDLTIFGAFGKLIDIVFLPLNMAINFVKGLFDWGSDDETEPFSLSGLLFDTISGIFAWFKGLLNIDIGGLVKKIPGAGKILSFFGFGGSDDKEKPAAKKAMPASLPQLPAAAAKKQDATMADKLAKTERVKQERRQKILERIDARIEATEDRILTGQDEKGRTLSTKRLEYEQKRLGQLERREQKLIARFAASGTPPPAGFNVSTNDKKVENHFPNSTQPSSPVLNANIQSSVYG